MFPVNIQNMVNNSKNFLFNRSEKTNIGGPFNVGREIQYLPDPQQQEAMDELAMDDCDDDVSDLFKTKLEIRDKNKKKKSLPGDKILKKIREDAIKKRFKKQQHQLKIQTNISKAVSSVIRS